MNNKNIFLKRFIVVITLILILVTSFTIYIFYNRIYEPNINLSYKDKIYVYIPSNSNFEDVQNILIKSGVLINSSSFKWVAEKKNYINKVKPGKYLVSNSMSNNDLVNLLRSGKQTPVNVMFNNIRTVEQFSQRISSQLEIDSLELINKIYDAKFLKKLNLNKQNISSLFIPNTYEFYWNVSVDKFLNKMVKEYKSFWNFNRLSKAKKIDLSKTEVTILASIVEKETIKKDEQPKVAGLYMNRLNQDIKLESDPTVIFAIGDFSIRRVLNKDLKFKSPYNTYLNKGLPPGPISFPSIQAIDAVLNYEEHNYIFMCAKDDFSGYHNFSTTYFGHLKNARKYRRALNRRGVKR